MRLQSRKRAQLDDKSEVDNAIMMKSKRKGYIKIINVKKFCILIDSTSITNYATPKNFLLGPPCLLRPKAPQSLKI